MESQERLFFKQSFGIRSKKKHQELIEMTATIEVLYPGLLESMAKTRFLDIEFNRFMQELRKHLSITNKLPIKLLRLSK